MTTLNNTNYPTSRTLEEQAEIAEFTSNLRREIAARHAICEMCSVPHYERKATTFCGDCGVELCDRCAVKVHIETYCKPCGDYHERTDLTPLTDTTT